MWKFLLALVAVNAQDLEASCIDADIPTALCDAEMEIGNRVALRVDGTATAIPGYALACGGEVNVRITYGGTDDDANCEDVDTNAVVACVAHEPIEGVAVVVDFKDAVDPEVNVYHKQVGICPTEWCEKICIAEGQVCIGETKSHCDNIEVKLIEQSTGFAGAAALAVGAMLAVWM